MELLRPTAAAEAPGSAGPDDAGDEGRGDGVQEPEAPKPRRKRPAPAGKTKARNIRLSDDVHDRLWLLARQRKQTVSAVADDLLNKALPRWDLKRLG
jgi:hypothetical protein